MLHHGAEGRCRRGKGPEGDPMLLAQGLHDLLQAGVLARRRAGDRGVVDSDDVVEVVPDHRGRQLPGKRRVEAVGHAVRLDRDGLPDGEGLRSLEEALALYRELGDRRGEANVLWGLGNRGYFGLSPDAGTDYFRQALEIFRTVGDLTMAAWSLHMLGSGLARLQRYDESRPALHQALRHFHDASDASGIALVLDDLASLAVADGELPRAARLRGAARRLTAATGAELAGFVDMQFERGIRPHVTHELSPEELERYGQEGARMTLDEAVAYALDTTIEGLRAGHDTGPVGLG